MRNNFTTIEGYESWADLQNELLLMFKKRSLPYLNPIPKNHLEWLVVAQHHGVPTSMMDWTSNPLKALFFAVESPDYENTDGVVWAFEPKGWYDDLTQLIELQGGNIKSLVSYFPDHIDSRAVAQESCFTIFPLNESTEPIKPLDDLSNYENNIKTLTRFVIPKEEKLMCRHELKKLGISHMSLFPGLDGIALSIRRELDLSW